jgi:sulfur-oxidizing protein SoxY
VSFEARFEYRRLPVFGSVDGWWRYVFGVNKILLRDGFNSSIVRNVIRLEFEPLNMKGRGLMNGEINLKRRNTLKVGGSMGLLALFGGMGLLKPGVAMADTDRKVFAAKTMDEALSAMGVILPGSSDLIQLSVPEIAENGAIVPIVVNSTLAKVEQIFVLADKNPNPLAAIFTFPEGTEGVVTTRIKMAKTSNVIALVKADGKFYKVMKEVKVTAGGCGG